MDPNRLKEAYQRLELLEERLGYKVRPRRGGLHSAGLDEVEQKVKDLAEYTIELKDIVREFLLAFSRPPKKSGPPQA